MMRLLRQITFTGCVAAAFGGGPIAAQQDGSGPSNRATESGSEREGAAASPWQAYFRQIAGEYRLRVVSEDQSLALVPNPLLKWSQPVRGGQDGAVFLWTRQGRPAVIGTFFIWPAGDRGQGLSHELHVLTNEKVEGDWRQAIHWRPPERPLEWQPLSDASPVAETHAARMIDARRLARRFAATSRTRDGQTYELRLQPRPFYQYESRTPGDHWLGGALFSIVQGTDTEVVLWLEAQMLNGSPVWRHAVARMSDLELHVMLDGKEVWTTGFARYDDLAGPYLCMAPEFFREPPEASPPESVAPASRR